MYYAYHHKSIAYRIFGAIRVLLSKEPFNILFQLFFEILKEIRVIKVATFLYTLNPCYQVIFSFENISKNVYTLLLNI